MKYKINDRHYADFQVFEVSKLPGRCYFIPYPSRAAAEAVTAKEKRYSSGKVLCGSIPNSV